MSDPIDAARDWLAGEYDGSKPADLLTALLIEADRLAADNAALRKLHEGACERIAAASEVIAARAERDALARLEAWVAAEAPRATAIWRPSCGWAVKLSSGVRAFDIRAYGWADAAPQVPDPTTVHCGDGATLSECILAALARWEELYGEQKGGA